MYLVYIYICASPPKKILHLAPLDWEVFRENDLDLNKIDTLQMKAIKQLVKKIEDIEKRKSDRIMYKLPVQICNYSLF